MDERDGLTVEIEVGRGRNAARENLDRLTVRNAWFLSRPHGRAWGKQLRFFDGDKRTHVRHVPDASLHGDPAALCAGLADEGLRINRSRQKKLVQYLCGVGAGARVTLVNRTGWHEIGGRDVFVLPSESIGGDSKELIVLDGAAGGPYEARGALEDWRAGVGELTKGQKLGVLAVSTALSGPLAHIVGAESAGLNLFGRSSIGKSSLLCAGASVWGRGATPGYLRSWRATANGLEGAAAGATDTALVLDELGVGEAREVAAAIYQLANGTGKARAGRDGSLREPKSWRVTILSSGELPVEGKLAEDRGRKTRAGQTVRLLDVPADRGLGFGVFDHAGGFDDAGKLADALKAAAVAAYGTAGPEFVRRLTASGLAEVTARGKKFIAEFTDGVCGAGASEQVRRAAKKFALIALAGKLATALGVTPWEKGEAKRAAVWAFRRWVEARGGAGSHEERQAIEQVRLVIEQYGELRFEAVDGPGDTVRDRLGWRKGSGPDREWWVPPQVWKQTVCDGLDANFVAPTLYKHGMLRRQNQKDLTCVVKLREPLTGEPSKTSAAGAHVLKETGRPRTARVYVLTAAILDGGS